MTSKSKPREIAEDDILESARNPQPVDDDAPITAHDFHVITGLLAVDRSLDVVEDILDRLRTDES